MSGEDRDEGWEALHDRVTTLTKPGHDRDVALAIADQARSVVSQPRHCTPIDEIQVLHLLAIGWRGGEAAGYRRAVQTLRGPRGQNDELVDAISEVTEVHHIEDDYCVCGDWGDGKDGPGWDQHMAEVTLKFLADHLEALAAAPRNEGAQT